VENQTRVPIEYFKKLTGTSGLWEVRIQSGSDIFRLLGFMDEGKLVVLTNGFTKKSQKTPANEIQIAELRKTDYLQRKGENK
jgi:phage-related protein